MEGARRQAERHWEGEGRVEACSRNRSRLEPEEPLGSSGSSSARVREQRPKKSLMPWRVTNCDSTEEPPQESSSIGAAPKRKRVDMEPNEPKPMEEPKDWLPP